MTFSPPGYFLTHSSFLRIGSGACRACSLPSCSVVCFAQTAVFALNTARNPVPSLSASCLICKQHLKSKSSELPAWTGKCSGRLLDRARFSKTHPSGAKMGYFPAHSKPVFKWSFLLKMAIVFQTLMCHLVWQSRNCLGYWKKKFLLRLRFCDSMIQGERVQGRMSMHVINAQLDYFGKKMA